MSYAVPSIPCAVLIPSSSISMHPYSVPIRSYPLPAPLLSVPIHVLYRPRAPSPPAQLPPFFPRARARRTGAPTCADPDIEDAGFVAPSLRPHLANRAVVSGPFGLVGRGGRGEGRGQWCLCGLCIFLCAFLLCGVVCVLNVFCVRSPNCAAVWAARFGTA